MAQSTEERRNAGRLWSRCTYLGMPPSHDVSGSPSSVSTALGYRILLLLPLLFLLPPPRHPLPGSGVFLQGTCTYRCIWDSCMTRCPNLASAPIHFDNTTRSATFFPWMVGIRSTVAEGNASVYSCSTPLRWLRSEDQRIRGLGKGEEGARDEGFGMKLLEDVGDLESADLGRGDRGSRIGDCT